MGVNALQQDHALEGHKVLNTHSIQLDFEGVVGCDQNHVQDFIIGDGRGSRHRFTQWQLNLPIIFEHTLKSGQIPLLFHRFFGYVLAHQVGKTAFAQCCDLGVHFGGVQDVIALLVNHLALIVGDVVVLQQLFAHVKVARFHFALRTFNAARDHAGFDGFAFWHFQTVHDGAHTVTRKNAHQRIVQAQIEA